MHTDRKSQRTAVLRILCVVALLAMLCSCGVTPQEPGQETVSDVYDLPLFDGLPEDHASVDPAFWVAESQNGGKVYLLGSIHVADKTAYRLPKHIMDAFLESEALAVEVDTVAYVTDEAAKKADTERTTYPDGDTLQNHIDPLMFKLLEEFIANNADDPQMLPSLKNRKPCTWLSALSDIESTAAGLSAEYGIDGHFLRIAHAQKKEIIEIESSASQYDALNSLPDKTYEFLFSTYVYQTADTLGDSLKQTYAAWKSGTLQAATEAADIEAADGDVTDYAAAISEYDRIICTERNAVMADAAKSYLDGGKKVFLVVGTDHLPGNAGVIARLEADGYSVTRLGGKEE